MGACFDAAFVNTTDKQAAKERFNDLLEQDRFENGHSYSGTIGMCNGVKFTDETFDSPDAAEDWLEENCAKWGPALGVRVKSDRWDGWFFGAICSS